MTLVAEMLGELDRQGGLKHPGHQGWQQASVAGHGDAVGPGLFHRTRGDESQIVTRHRGPGTVHALRAFAGFEELASKP